MTKTPKKLIEVALPLDEINEAALNEKKVKQGHPSGLHHWWARRPLAAARAVLFAQLVNDPGGERGWGNYPGQSKDDAQKERERLFDIIRGLVGSNGTVDNDIMKSALHEIDKSWRETCELNRGLPGFDETDIPGFHDPFAGGGAIPYEAQRLGLTSYASDLNPVAVLINKVMIEFSPQFAGLPPVGPAVMSKKKSTKIYYAQTGLLGFSEDVRRYGALVLNRATESLSKCYPSIHVTENMAENRDDLAEYIGKDLQVISYIWARTVKSPNPMFSGVEVPLTGSFTLSKKPGQEYYIHPIIDQANSRYDFVVKKGVSHQIEKTVSRGGAICIMSGTPFKLSYIREQGKKRCLGKKLMAIVAEGKRGRIYIDPKYYEDVNINTLPLWAPTLKISHMPRDIKVQTYGMLRFEDLFTERQILSLNTFSDAIIELHSKIVTDASAHGFKPEVAIGYANAVVTVLAFALDKLADLNNSLCCWEPIAQCPRHLFTKQSIPIAWDFAESNPLSSSSGSWATIINGIAKIIEKNFYFTPVSKGYAVQADAVAQDISKMKIVSTDPPYYDNIAYADLSDFFYVWLRKTLQSIYPDLFASMATPKENELIAHLYRRDGKEDAYAFFMNGMFNAIKNIQINAHPAYPVTVYYAFKQAETDDNGTSSSGWESFLTSVVDSGFSITGTWPLRTENASRLLSQGKNVLASSIVLVLRKRDSSAPSISRKDFLRELKSELPESLEAMIGGKKGATPIAPVDLAQSSIGPGMAVYSRYSKVIEADGSTLSVHDAIIQINKVIDEYFNEVESDMDSDTRFCIDWFMQYGFKHAEFGQADVLARAKGTTVDGLAHAGVVDSGGGKVRLFKFEEYPDDWNPGKDTHTPIWEALHQLIRALRSGGEAEAGLLLQKMADRTESIRQLAYRLYTLCERKGWAEEARAYNELIASWHGTIEAAEQAHLKARHPKQLTLDM